MIVVFYKHHDSRVCGLHRFTPLGNLSESFTYSTVATAQVARVIRRPLTRSNMAALGELDANLLRLRLGSKVSAVDLLDTGHHTEKRVCHSPTSNLEEAPRPSFPKLPPKSGPSQMNSRTPVPSPRRGPNDGLSWSGTSRPSSELPLSRRLPHVNSVGDEKQVVHDLVYILACSMVCTLTPCSPPLLAPDTGRRSHYQGCQPREIHPHPCFRAPKGDH